MKIKINNNIKLFIIKTYNVKTIIFLFKIFIKIIYYLI